MGSKYRLASLCHVTKGKIPSKSFTKTATGKLVPGPSVLTKNKAQLLLANEVFEASYFY